MRDNRSIEERLSDVKEDYCKIPVPEEMKARLEEGIARAEAEKEFMRKGMEEEEKMRDHHKMEEKDGYEEMEKKKSQEMRSGNNSRMDHKKIVRFRIAGAVAAAALILVVLPNTGAGVAHAMGSLPVVGKLFQAVTFRDYQYESERFDANVEVPQIVVEDVGQEGTEPSGERAEEDGRENAGKDKEEHQNGGAASDQLQDTVEQINFDIEEVTNRLIEEFQESADLGESYGTLEIHHETVTNNERYFTLKLSLYQGAGSGFESYKFYTIDKRTGKQVQISDLFREDSNYNEILSENIREQMKAKMAEDENNIYWVDNTDIPEWNFERLKEDQNFYFDGEGNIVISFDEYEVAPGYMGAQEFTVEKEVFEGLLKG